MKRIDFFLLIPTLLLSLFGLLMIFDASSFIAAQDFHNKYYFLKEQSLWLLLGLIALGFFSLFDYKRLYNLALPLLMVSAGLLLLVFIPGIGVSALGAHRWINMRFFILQPAEFIKLVLAIYLAAWFSTKEKGRFLAFMLLLGCILFLVMMEPDMGTTIIILSEALILFFLSGGPLRYFMYLFPILGIGGVLLILIEPYRAQRLTAFLHSDSASGMSYHVQQILIALGSGGLMGVGIGNSLQKYAYLPENVTDSIFAILAEEFGFIGSVMIMGVFLFVIWRGFYIAMKTKDPFGKLLASGLTAFLGMQVVINLAAQTALVPLTGIPLPFISYGGSALIIDLCSIGILLNIAKQNK